MGRMKNIVVIGCGGAGMFSAIVATQLRPGKFKATILSDEKTIYCRCSTPYILTKEATLRDAIQPDAMIKDYGVYLVAEKAFRIDVAKKVVISDKGSSYPFDILVIASGARAFQLPVPGADSSNVFTVRTSDDVAKIKKQVKQKKKALVVGGGVIGIEMAGALHENNVSTTLVELQDKLLPGVTDLEFEKKIRGLLHDNHITQLLSSSVQEIKTMKNKKKLVVIKTKNGLKKIEFDFVILATGIRPNTEFLNGSSVKLEKGYVIVNNKMRTNKRNIFACGDCVTSSSALTNEKWPCPLASSAIQQAKIVGFQIADFPINYHGHTDAFAFQTLGKEFAQVGFDESKAREKFRFVVVGRAKTTNIYKDMKNVEDLEVKLIFAGVKMRLVGAQAFGNGVTGHIETASLAISLKANMLKLLRFNYIAHPSLTPWPFMNPLIMATEDAIAVIKNKFSRKK